MNKKLKKMLATVSAMAMCAVSAVSVSAGALCTSANNEVTPYTTSFSVGEAKYHLWEEATDYFDDETFNVYISESLIDTKYGVLGSYHQVLKEEDQDNWYDFCNVCIMSFGTYVLDNENDIFKLENYLSNNNIEYTATNVSFNNNSLKEICIDFPAEMNNIYDNLKLLIDIKENTGFVSKWYLAETSLNITDVENALPAVTLSGDTNEDSDITIADAVLIMQSLSNPDKYQLTPQGTANADTNGDGGVTAADSLKIQEMLANK